MIKYLIFSDLDDSLVKQYREAIRSAFPNIILNSQITKKYWNKLEKYFPQTQLFMVDDNNLIGFMNAIPIFWDESLKLLPDEGWDWLIKKGIEDFENNIIPNSLGGLQIVVDKKYQGKGYSKLLIAKGKKVKNDLRFKNFIIPIRPILKYKYPEMMMKDYMVLKRNDRILDPWIRTHLESGADIIKVCKNSMNIKGDIPFWEGLLGEKIIESGTYTIDGALNHASINVENNFGEYREENVWVQYR